MGHRYPGTDEEWSELRGTIVRDLDLLGRVVASSGARNLCRAKGSNITIEEAKLHIELKDEGSHWKARRDRCYLAALRVAKQVFRKGHYLKAVNRALLLRARMVEAPPRINPATV